LEARGYVVFAPTLPLHPAQGPGELAALGRLSLTDYVTYLESAIAAARLPAPPVLIGHSMGGLLAQALAARNPARACILLAPAPPAGVATLRLDQVWASRSVWLTPAFWRKPQQLPDAHAEQLLLGEVEPQLRARLRASLLPESGRVFAEIAFWWLDRRRATHVDSSALRAPVLVVGGADDRIIPAAVVRGIASRYRQSELLLLPGRGHWFFEEPGADEVFARVGSWLDLVCAVTDERGAPRPAPPRVAAPAPLAVPA
jgi:pimeloyl-ACP methyl ester carboxylesterase